MNRFVCLLLLGLLPILSFAADPVGWGVVTAVSAKSYDKTGAETSPVAGGTLFTLVKEVLVNKQPAYLIMNPARPDAQRIVLAEDCRAFMEGGLMTTEAFAQAVADGLNHVDGHTVACLLICLGVRGDSKDLVDLFLIKALESQAFPGHQASNTSAAFHYPLERGNIVGDSFSYPSGTGFTARVGHVHTVTGYGFLISLFRSIPNQQHSGPFRPMVG